MLLRVLIRTFGCELNRADSQMIAKLFEGNPIEVVDSEEDADAVVVNTCTVREETEHKVLKYISSLGRKKVVATGCMAAAQPGLLRYNFPEISIVTLNNLHDMIRALQGGVISVKKGDSLSKPASFTRGLVHTIPISRGCLGECSYCIVRLARGKLLSVAPEEILQIIENAVVSGALEIRLAAQDTGVYGKDIGASLVSLLNRAVAIPYEFRVRVGMFNLSSVSSCFDELMECYTSNKIYKFVHIPLQSGSDRILSIMRRGYTAELYLEAVSDMRRRFPQMTLATDVIVGYPGETEDDFRETCKVLDSITPDKIHISRFAPRPHTPAALLKQIPEPVKKARSRILTSKKIAIQTERNRGWIGREVEATALSYRRGFGVVARTDEYKPVIVECAAHSTLGARLLLEVVGCSPFSLTGRIIRR